MRAFILISSVICFTSARPDVGTQSYLPPNGGLAGAGSNLFGSGGQGGFGSPATQGGFGGQALGGFQGAAGAGQGGFQGGNLGDYQNYAEEPLVNKHFYVHSAPEDRDGSHQPKHFTLGRAQKNYRVVFIKAPSSGDANTKLSAEYAPSEEKTHIYVLAQKEHELDANDIATPEPTQPSKPEVFFIKYKTPEEAAHAQQEIQAQYDALGGTSEVSDEGVAPLSSVEGSLGHSGGHGGNFGGHGGALGGHGGALGGHGGALGGHGGDFGGHGGDFGGQGAGSSLSGASIAANSNYLPPNRAF